MKKNQKNAWIVSLIVFVIWLVIVFGGDPTGLDALVQGQIVPALVIAPIFLLIVVAYFKWWRPVGLKWVDNTRSLLLLWLPALMIIFLLIVG